MEIKKSDSLDGKRDLIQTALDSKRKPKGKGSTNCVPVEGCWVSDVFPKHAIVQAGGEYYAYRYQIKDGKALLGKRIPVEVVYRAKRGATTDDWEKVVDRS